MSALNMLRVVAIDVTFTAITLGSVSLRECWRRGRFIMTYTHYDYDYDYDCDYDYDYDQGNGTQGIHLLSGHIYSL